MTLTCRDKNIFFVFKLSKTKKTCKVAVTLLIELFNRNVFCSNCLENLQSSMLIVIHSHFSCAADLRRAQREKYQHRQQQLRLMTLRSCSFDRSHLYRMLFCLVKIFGLNFGRSAKQGHISRSSIAKFKSPAARDVSRSPPADDIAMHRIFALTAN